MGNTGSFNELNLEGVGASSEIAVDLSLYRHKRSWQYLFFRLLWACVQIPFWSRMPRRVSFLRILLLRLFGAKIGRGCLISSGVRIWEPWNFEMGEYTSIGTGAEIYNLAKITLGNSTVVSQRAYLCSATHDYSSRSFPLFAKPITVADNAWIAAEAFVAPGVNIGVGAVIGARSVVTKDVPQWTVCAGSPCRILRKRMISS
jgi:putative colanic acid biosynthesis acetyltransferase WcaF